MPCTSKYGKLFVLPTMTDHAQHFFASIFISANCHHKKPLGILLVGTQKNHKIKEIEARKILECVIPGRHCWNIMSSSNLVQNSIGASVGAPRRGKKTTIKSLGGIMEMNLNPYLTPLPLRV